MNFQVLLLAFFIHTLKAEDEDGILCTAKTCSDYISENPCTSLPDYCNIQNSTNNGIFLPSPDPCGCCQYCLVNLNEGDYCAEGEDGGLIPDTICGPGLSCSGGRCVKMTEIDNPPICSKAEAEYNQRREAGTLGFMEVSPNCDNDGFYLPYKCVPGQTCFCVDKNGERIFGEIAYTNLAPLHLRCQCSRKYHEVLKFFDRDYLHPNEHFRCTSTGDYDTIQCIGDNCMCTDSLDGAPTFPAQASVNMSDISNSTLGDCFEEGVHLEQKYYYDCAQKYVEILTEIEAYKAEGYDTVFGVDFPNCDLDGKYAPVWTVKTVTDHQVEEISSYHCVYPDGTRIGNYVGYPDDTIEIDCKCARSNLLLSESIFERPECCRNGNFNRVQCRRGTCYCVDSNGYQDVDNSDSEKLIEADISEKKQLFCYDAAYEQECLGKS